jgi:hypothetical protein
MFNCELTLHVHDTQHCKISNYDSSFLFKAKLCHTVNSLLEVRTLVKALHLQLQITKILRNSGRFFQLSITHTRTTGTTNSYEL